MLSVHLIIRHFNVDSTLDCIEREGTKIIRYNIFIDYLTSLLLNYSTLLNRFGYVIQ